jgi:RNA polymerase sigma-70 factor (ECF subfamily)
MAYGNSTARRIVEPLEPFISQIRPSLLKKAIAMCRNRTDAEDLVQEASLRFLKSFASASTLPPENAIEGWLILTMTNCFFDQCRKRLVEKQAAKDPTMENSIVAPPTNIKLLSDTISDEDFSAAIKKLSPKLRETFELRASGRRNKEISDQLGIDIGLVAKRLHDARKKLLKWLTPPDSSSGDH